MQRELPVDLLEFFILTPLPGSADHKALYLDGAWMDPDMNKYDLEHVVMAHPKMTQAEWEGIYRQAWKLYYSPEHIETLLRRAFVTGIGPSRLATMLAGFACIVEIENLHPLQSGIVRLKWRADRRRGSTSIAIPRVQSGCLMAHPGFAEVLSPSARGHRRGYRHPLPGRRRRSGRELALALE